MAVSILPRNRLLILLWGSHRSLVSESIWSRDNLSFLILFLLDATAPITKLAVSVEDSNYALNDFITLSDWYDVFAHEGSGRKLTPASTTRWVKGPGRQVTIASYLPQLRFIKILMEFRFYYLNSCQFECWLGKATPSASPCHPFSNGCKDHSAADGNEQVPMFP